MNQSHKYSLYLMTCLSLTAGALTQASTPNHGEENPSYQNFSLLGESGKAVLQGLDWIVQKIQNSSSDGDNSDQATDLMQTKFIQIFNKLSPIERTIILNSLDKGEIEMLRELGIDVKEPPQISQSDLSKLRNIHKTGRDSLFPLLESVTRQVRDILNWCRALVETREEHTSDDKFMDIMDPCVKDANGEKHPPFICSITYNFGQPISFEELINGQQTSIKDSKTSFKELMKSTINNPRQDPSIPDRPVAETKSTFSLYPLLLRPNLLRPNLTPIRLLIILSKKKVDNVFTLENSQQTSGQNLVTNVLPVPLNDQITDWQFMIICDPRKTFVKKNGTFMLILDFINPLLTNGMSILVSNHSLAIQTEENVDLLKSSQKD